MDAYLAAGDALTGAQTGAQGEIEADELSPEEAETA